MQTCASFAIFMNLLDLGHWSIFDDKYHNEIVYSANGIYVITYISQVIIKLEGTWIGYPEKKQRTKLRGHRRILVQNNEDASPFCIEIPLELRPEWELETFSYTKGFFCISA